MTLRLSTATAVFLVCFPALADDPAVNLAGFHLKNRSAFTAAQNVRPPFWPIGWVHQAKGSAPMVVQEKFTLDPQMFSVTSILVGHPSLAVINARSYAEGDLLKGTARNPQTWPQGIKIRVQKITDGNVTLISDIQSIVVPMHRPELNDHKSEQEEETQLLQN